MKKAIFNQVEKSTQKIHTGDIVIVGGDQRQAYLANELADDGFIVNAVLSETNHLFNPAVKKRNDLKYASKNAGVFIFPVPFCDADGFINTPFSKQKVTDLEFLSLIKPNSFVFGGKIPPGFIEKAKEKNIKVTDFLKREEFAILNGIPTAEGAIEIAIREKSITLWKSKCLVCGYGNIAAPLAKILSAMGAETQILTKSTKSKSKAQSDGFQLIKNEELKDKIGSYDVVFNTAPERVFVSEVLKNASRNCLFIDLASKPGGIDFECAKEQSLQVIWALALPAKTAPVTAGRIVKNTILNVLSERGDR